MISVSQNWLNAAGKQPRKPVYILAIGPPSTTSSVSGGGVPYFWSNGKLILMKAAAQDVSQFGFISAQPDVAGQITSGSLAVSVVSPGAGNFTVAHTLGRAPVWASLMMTSGGRIWFQAVSFDANNLYLAATDSGLTATILIW